jgi:hypothetical protein
MRCCASSSEANTLDLPAVLHRGRVRVALVGRHPRVGEHRRRGVLPRPTEQVIRVRLRSDHLACRRGRHPRCQLPGNLVRGRGGAPPPHPAMGTTEAATASVATVLRRRWWTPGSWGPSLRSRTHHSSASTASRRRGYSQSADPPGGARAAAELPEPGGIASHLESGFDELELDLQVFQGAREVSQEVRVRGCAPRVRTCGNGWRWHTGADDQSHALRRAYRPRVGRGASRHSHRSEPHFKVPA